MRTILLTCLLVLSGCGHFNRPAPLPPELVRKVRAVGGDCRRDQNGTIVIDLRAGREGKPWDTERSQELFRYLQSVKSPFALSAMLGLTPEEWQSLGNCHELIGLDLAMNELRDGSLQYLVQCKKLRSIFLDFTRASATELNALAELPSLKKIYISYTGADDNTVSRLAHLPELEELDLGDTQVTDQSMSALARSPKLKSLSIRNLPITDQGLLELSRIKHFESLDVSGTKVTLEGIRKFLESTTVHELTGR